MIKISDFIIKHLTDNYGIQDIFMITGGGAMHLNDSVGTNKKINYICNHHEQAAAIAAEGYSRLNGKLGVVLVTSGPGGTNTLTGLMGQWTDSIPVLYISGQVKQETTINYYNSTLRQLGDQEIDIISLVKNLTKYSKTITNAKETKKILDEAIYYAIEGRPGPVWIDVPLDIQGSIVNEDDLISFDPPKTNYDIDNLIIDEVELLLKKSKRPVIIAGHGIRISKAEKDFLSLVEKIQIPILSTFNGFDLINTDNKFFIGRIGTLGTRAGNFALQNADLIISIGSRNNIRQISYNWKNFGKNAKKIFIDIDKKELEKPTIEPDMVIHGDAKIFIKKLLEVKINPMWSEWLEWNIQRKNRYPVVLKEYKNSDKVHPYFFVKELTTNLKNSDVVVAGNGTACVALFQAGIVKSNQRIFWNSGCASMGYDLPAAIGACFSNSKYDIICLTGEGSLQMNIQEFATIKHYNLPIKTFVLNNNGYCSIRQTQSNFFNGRYVGCDESSGLYFPSLKKIAKTYGIPYKKLSTNKNLNKKIKKILNSPGSAIIEVDLTLNYIFSPKLSSEKLPDGRLVSKPLEDLYPFLSREEFEENIIKDWKY